MPAPRTPRWTKPEIAILREHYPQGGMRRVGEMLPSRTWRSIYMKANKLGLRCELPTDAPKPKLQGDQLEEAIRLREVEGWSFARIGAHFGLAEGSACNAVMIALCTRKGFTPAQRDPHGRLTAEGIERVRLALKKGWKGIDIQLHLGISASCVAEQRRRYNADLKERAKAPLPAPGGGVMYSGVKVAKSKKAEVEQLYLQGLGTQKVSQRTNVSHTTCLRIRTRLVNKLRRKGEALPGCDINGARHIQAESSRFITDVQKAVLRQLLLDRVPVRRAAAMAAIGSSSAYRLRDELIEELRQKGQALPSPRLPGRVRTGQYQQNNWPPVSAKSIYAFRALLADGLSFADAKARWQNERRAERQAEAARPKTFEEQLAAVAAGKAQITTAFARAHLEPRLAEERPVA
ncbi:hypothetical protein DXH95_02940 [Sphingorhabdus pulchriflava]|uniref:Uncharacterized protein n=1 Tax=Sphingorhabdus pulchriflava TaxID=2292257 RepID=A0A371BFW6_9SPHN|nr:hypothetical protein [Sphingorhabdus pulchriflava]RDV06397.1 hypothetical protein DXH95_02940 [Sphingorhabdus pulchriflava]